MKVRPERERFHAGPQRQDDQSQDSGRLRARKPGNRKRAERPEQDGVRIVPADVVGLRNQIDVRAKQDRAEQKQGLREPANRTVRPRQRPAGGQVNAPHSAEQHRQLGELGHAAPIRREKQDDAGADGQDAQDGEGHRRLARAGCARLKLLQNGGLAIGRDPAALDPGRQIPLEPPEICPIPHVVPHDRGRLIPAALTTTSQRRISS